MTVEHDIVKVLEQRSGIPAAYLETLPGMLLRGIHANCPTAQQVREAVLVVAGDYGWAGDDEPWAGYGYGEED